MPGLKILKVYLHVKGGCCMVKSKEYALYKGEELLCIGTIKQIAEHQGVQEETIKFYGTDSYKKRISKRMKSTDSKVLVCLDDE